MALLGHIDAHDEIVAGLSDLALQLTELFEPAILILYHRDLLVRV